MQKLDMFVLSKFQAVSDWYQEWFGGDNFILAKISLAMVWMFSLLENVLEMADKGNFGATAFFFFFNAVLTAAGLPIVLGGERSCKNNPAFRNPCEEILKWMRILQLCGVPILAIIFVIAQYIDNPFPRILLIADFSKLHPDHAKFCAWMSLLVFVMWTFFVYFGSCTPKPPKEGRIGQFLSRFAPSTT
jgi:hypothetical protein